MWMERKKNNAGKNYFYLYTYKNGQKDSRERFMSLGCKKSALKILNSFRLKKNIPTEILQLESYKNLIEKWKKKVKKSD